MASAKSWHDSEPPHGTAEATAWAMIVILLGFAAFALFILWWRVRG